MKLLIVSNMAHYLDGGRVLGWGPAVREIDQLAEVFDEVRHLAMLHRGPPPRTSLPYCSRRISFIALPPSGGRGIRGKLRVLLRSPQYVNALLRELRRAEAVHVRCPANICLEALALLRFVKQPTVRWAKFAGNWRPDGREPFFYRLQRQWLERGIHGGLVTVNGHWPSQPAHVFSFPNPCFSEAEYQLADALSRNKRPRSPLRLLFAGRFRASKGADRAIRILAELRNRGIDTSLDLAGDGPEGRTLEQLAARLGIAESVRFHGWLPRAALERLYRLAHFFLLPSSTEGWPKVLSEAMAFRAVPLAGAVSCIPQILEATGAGVALRADDVGGFVDQIEELAHDSAAWRRMADNGQRAAAAFTYEAYLGRVRGLLRVGSAERAETAAGAGSGLGDFPLA